MTGRLLDHHILKEAESDMCRFTKLNHGYYTSQRIHANILENKALDIIIALLNNFQLPFVFYSEMDRK
jgi:hypothetical protein